MVKEKAVRIAKCTSRFITSILLAVSLVVVCPSFSITSEAANLVIDNARYPLYSFISHDFNASDTFTFQLNVPVAILFDANSRAVWQFYFQTYGEMATHCTPGKGFLLNINFANVKLSIANNTFYPNSVNGYTENMSLFNTSDQYTGCSPLYTFDIPNQQAYAQAYEGVLSADVTITYDFARYYNSHLTTSGKETTNSSGTSTTTSSNISGYVVEPTITVSDLKINCINTYFDSFTNTAGLLIDAEDIVSNQKSAYALSQSILSAVNGLNTSSIASELQKQTAEQQKQTAELEKQTAEQQKQTTALTEYENADKMDSDNSDLSSAIGDYETTEKSLFESASSHIDGFDIASSFKFSAGLLNAMSFLATILTEIIGAFGEFSILYILGMGLVIIAMIFGLTNFASAHGDTERETGLSEQRPARLNTIWIYDKGNPALSGSRQKSISRHGERKVIGVRRSGLPDKRK